MSEPNPPPRDSGSQPGNPEDQTDKSSLSTKRRTDATNVENIEANRISIPFPPDDDSNPPQLNKTHTPPISPFKNQGENKRRRTSLLGNLTQDERNSKAYSAHHLTHHLSPDQRPGGPRAVETPPDDYYLMDELDNLGIFLEKPEELPGGIEFLNRDMNMTPPSKPVTQDAEPEPPVGVIYPVQRNTVELQTKLAVIRNLKGFAEHNQWLEPKSYYEEDEVDLSFMVAKPPSFLILGKPGVGKTTLAMRLADKMHCVHLNPEKVIEYFHRTTKEPLSTVRINDLLDEGDSISDGLVVQLLIKRIREFDILHRGYVLEGFPLITSDELALQEQLNTLSALPIPPEYLILLQMQDKDLYKRRTRQKFDPGTGRVFIEQQYLKSDPDDTVFNRKSIYQSSPHSRPHYGGGRVFGGDEDLSDNPITEEASDTEKRTTPPENDQLASAGKTNADLNELDFPKLPPEILDRLFFRTEDFNVIVNDDLESFRCNFGELQGYVQSFDKRKVIEVDAYWSPTIIFRRVWEFCEAVGLQPVPVPLQIMRPMSMHFYKNQETRGEVEEEEESEEDSDDEDDDESEDDIDDETQEQSKTMDNTDVICEDEPPPEVDWEVAIRAICVRGLIDPRFRWRVSRWYNICPVALKLGRSLVGKPDLAVTFMDKVFFLSSKKAADQFINNPRPYLLPKMPTSPIKFVVLGHPLAGKTTFARELAGMNEGRVVDVNKEIARRFASVKRDHMWKKKLKYSLEAAHIVNKENALRWQRQERTRRRDMHAWIENHLRELAEAEIQAALDRDHDELHRLRVELRKQSEYHAMGEPYAGSGMCQMDDATLHFDWKRFVQEAFGGKKEWTHQESLELAWDLFSQRRLYYKKIKRDTINLTVFKDFTDSNSEEEFGPAQTPEVTASYESSEEEVSEAETPDSGTETRKRHKKKKKRKCIHLEVGPISPEEILEPFLFETFDVDPNDPEVEESVRMRFPMTPFELIDIVPSPAQVGDVDPEVKMIVEEKLAKEGAYVDTVPPEIFVQILKLAVADIERVYRKKTKQGSLTGGWIIDNFPPDIDKWRATLRTPQICPDQVFLLLDLTDGNMTVWSRFKWLFKLLHPSASTAATLHVEEEDPEKPKSKQLEQIPGEDHQHLSPFTPSKKPPTRLQALTAEDDHDYSKGLTVNDAASSAHNTTRKSTTGGPAKEDDLISRASTAVDVDKLSLEVVSRSHFMLSLLPQDDLNDVASTTQSEQAIIDMDLHRTQTVAFSEADSNEDLIEQTLQGYGKYMLDSIHKGLKVEIDDDDEDSLGSDDYEDLQRRRDLAHKLKPIYGEMTACLSSMQGTLSRTNIPNALNEPIQNPPGTPEEEDDDEEEGTVLKKPRWTVPVPSEIETGELPLTKEEMKIKEALEAQIHRLSATFVEDEMVKTPPELGSETSMRMSAVDDAHEKEALFQKLLNTKIESPKRKFFAQVRTFNEFWNMALPVCNQQGVRFWEVGLCDEETALEKGIFFWNELERRFDAKAHKILETELKEEDEEIMASLMKWGEPYEVTDIRYRSPGKDPNRDDDGDDDDSYYDDEDDDDGTDANSDTSSRQSSRERDKDELTNLENKPDLYWKGLERREAERCFGDFKYYCPVTYLDFNLLRKGFSRYACKYKDQLYYCASEDNQLRFLTNPKLFLPVSGPPTPPPPRICITGSPGCLQEEIASALCSDFKVCYVNFRQKLHEIMKARLGQEIGPEQRGFIIPKEETESALAKADPEDDLLTSSKRNKVRMEEDDEVVVEGELGGVPSSFRFRTMTSRSRMLIIPKQEIKEPKSQMAIQDSSLKTLGLLGSHNIETIPMTSIERTETLTERRWEKLTWIEAHIQAFLESGVQLPDDVLDNFILPLWKETPFTNVGFILVGFPNTYADIQYMLKRNLIPEHVFVMECKSIVVRNRLIIPAVDRWHHEQNPSGMRTKRLTMRTERAKFNMEAAALGRTNEDSDEIFPYQVSGRPTVDEFENETWSYNDSLARDVSRALKYFHHIYSGGLEKMKKILNRERFGWTPVNTNTGMYQGKHKVLESCTSMLKYRRNIFEDTVLISFSSAQALLDRGVFTLSPLQRWCPVELANGNTGINLWNAQSTKRIPYLHRRFIYFVSGEKNAKHFEENTWELTSQHLPLQPIPLVCIVLGKTKTGKTTLARSLSEKLGLLYVSCLEAVQSVLYHAFVTEWAPVLHEVNPNLVTSGHQPMTLANELLEYVRQGRSIPRFLVYRCLDLYLMNPKAQCNGVVFDDFPTLTDELIELNYREMSPSIVINLRIPITEAYTRCEASRPSEIVDDEQIPEDANDCIDYLWDLYGEATKETFQWFTGEYQNIHRVDGSQNPAMVLKEVSQICIAGQRKIQNYMVNLYHGKPNTLEGTCPITSNLFKRLNQEYGFFCPVALNDSDELVSVREITDLSQVVEYKGKIYLFSSKNAVKKFIALPKRYTTEAIRSPPKDVAQTIEVSPQDWERMQEHWGFMDFDPVLYFANHHYKGLQRGDPKYCVVYRRKLYVFISEENQKRFMKKPTQYWNLLLPMKVPRKAEPIDYDKITPFGYLTSKKMVSILKRVVRIMAEKRPRAPFMNTDQCAALYMGYYLKTQNMHAPYTTRQKYRNAMFQLSTIKSSTKEFLTELQNYYGCRPRNFPERMKNKLDEFMKSDYLPTDERILCPKLPGVTLSYDAVPAPFTDPQVARKVRKMMNSMREVELREKLDAFSAYSKKKKAADDASARAAQDAKDAADLAKKLMERASMRMMKAKSHMAQISHGGMESSGDGVGSTGNYD